MPGVGSEPAVSCGKTVLALFHPDWSLLHFEAVLFGGILPRLKPKSTVGLLSRKPRTDCMCQSCVEIDKQIEQYRELLRSTRDQKEIERISRMIAKLYGDRVLLHRNPER